MHASRLAATLATAVTLVVALPGIAHAAERTFRNDDGSAETSVHVDRPRDDTYTFLSLPEGVLGSATSATLWAYGQAVGCDAAPAEPHRVVVSATRLGLFDPCAVFPTETFGWASFDVPLSALRYEADIAFRNYVAIIDETADTQRTARYAVDTSSSEDSQIIDFHDGDGGFSYTRIPGRMLFYLTLSGTKNALGSARAVDYGFVRRGEATTRTVTVTSSGFTTAHVTDVSVTGAAAAEFAVTADGCTGAALPVGASCTVEVTFTPAEWAPRSATLTISAGSGTPAVVALRGVGASEPPWSYIIENVGPLVAGTPVTPITGGTFDDLGVAEAYVTFTPLTPAPEAVTLRADLACDAARRWCSWSVDPTLVLPGAYTVTAHGVDVQGIAESPGATVTGVVV